MSADGHRISGITQPPLAATCMRLLFDDHPDERRARALLRDFHAWHRFLLTQRSPCNYWRGPVWANVTWLSALGLRLHGEDRAASALREQMLGAIEGGGMREYFAPESGRGLGARDFAWTAALCLRELRPT